MGGIVSGLPGNVSQYVEKILILAFEYIYFLNRM
jgi:hypothetical protein